MEVSNPSMHLNQLLKELGTANSTLGVANQARAACHACQPARALSARRVQALFALLFFVCRLLVGPFVVYATLVSPTTPTVVKAGGAGILIVSLVWFQKVRPGCSEHRRCMC